MASSDLGLGLGNQTATDPQELFDRESEQLHLSPQLKSLLEPFVPKTANHVSAESLSV